MNAARGALIVLALGAAGCAGAPGPAVARSYVHPESAVDVRLNEALDAAPSEKVPSTLFDYAWKMPLVVPHTVAIFVRELPGALASFASTPVALVAGLLESLGILKPSQREVPPDPRERPR